MVPIHSEREVKDTSEKEKEDGGSFLERPENEQGEDKRPGTVHNSLRAP